ncbi:hypothetical protein [Treponema sp. OMZ 855]|uniref:hypothetical protein n=1 Tax=Treponema sp. OMZ 855 TaxID=1643512 RepID=UPI0020A4845C|nr:hypothetical protein [Treponema sp. OMZ 855]UTC50318.1 hypothetical protein E4N65_09550 [Treponema sp. OMZ 855]
MKGLIIKYICIILWYWVTVSIPCFSEETFERQLEKNIERIGIENYYLLETVYRERHGPVPSIAVYCDGGFYSLYDTGLEYEKIGNKRYFFDYKVNDSIKKLSTEIADKNMPLNDFINTYLAKNEHDESYRISDFGYGPFLSSEMMETILFAAQYSYDFLILAENGYEHEIKLYLPDSYEYALKYYEEIYGLKKQK